MTDATSQDDSAPTRRSLAEWVTLAISLAILVAIVGLITWLYYRGAEEPPVLVPEPRMSEVREADGAWYLPIEVANDGDRTIGDVVIEAELATGSGEPETAEFTITYLAGGERVTGTVVFSSDPAAGELSVRPVSYTSP